MQCSTPPLPSLTNKTSTSNIYTLSLHDALPISMLLNLLSQHLIRKGHTVESAASVADAKSMLSGHFRAAILDWKLRSEEHTSELQSRENLVCRLLLEKKNKRQTIKI